jgi:hypothetical protein
LRKRDAVERFWEKVQIGAPDECWPWTAGKTGEYGIFNAGSGRRVVRSHIFALEQRLGRRLLAGMCSCHECDNPPCCNPWHLFEGTKKDNAIDAGMKGRLSCVISDEVVRATREMAGTKLLVDIGAQLGISAASASRYIRRIDGGGRRFVDMPCKRGGLNG